MRSAHCFSWEQRSIAYTGETRFIILSEGKGLWNPGRATHVMRHTVRERRLFPPAVDGAIAGRVAFFPNVVEVNKVATGHPGTTPDQVVLHTDAGDGASPKEHWPANVSDPPP